MLMSDKVFVVPKFVNDGIVALSSMPDKGAQSDAFPVFSFNETGKAWKRVKKVITCMTGLIENL